MLKRLRALRLFRESFDKAEKSGVPKDEALDAAWEAVRAEYGASPDWAAIIELIFQFLALLGLL